MKKNLLIIVALLCSAIGLWAQPMGVSKPVKTLETATGLMSPVWSPDGTMLAATGNNYEGIYIATADGSDMRQIATDAGAGYKMTWSADSRKILGRTSVREGYKIVHEVKTWNVKDGTCECLVAKTRELKGTPTWSKSGAVRIATKTGRRLLGDNTNREKAVADNAYTLMTEDPAGAAAQIESLKQFEGKIIINPALSPDGQRVAFQVPGRGMMVCDIDGSNLIRLGTGMYPAWLPDSKNLIYTLVKDDGMNITSSALRTINTATLMSKTLLDDSEYIPMTPSVSSDGTKVAFENAADRAIYVVTLKY